MRCAQRIGRHLKNKYRIWNQVFDVKKFSDCRNRKNRKAGSTQNLSMIQEVEEFWSKVWEEPKSVSSNSR